MLSTYIYYAPPPLSKKKKKVCDFWSLRASPQTPVSAFFNFFFFFYAMKRCPIAVKIAGSIGILPHCVLKYFFSHRGILYFVYGKFGLVPITVYTCIM